MSKPPYSKWFNVYYSQNMEDLILKSFFPDIKDGFYVDVGAQDPEVFSVTKLFYDEGWNGINIEPQERYFRSLTKQRSRDTNLQAVLAAKKGSLMFREYVDATGLSTVSAEMKEDYELTESRVSEVTKNYREYSVDALTLKDVLTEYAPDRQVHFLKIDVEGFEAEVIKGNDWQKFRPLVLCVESNHIKEDWVHALNDFKYTEFMFDGLNRYFIADESYAALAEKFDYATTVLSRIPLSSVPYSVFIKDISKLSRELAKINKILKNQDDLIHVQESRIKELDLRISRLKLERGITGSARKLRRIAKTRYSRSKGGKEA